MKEGFCEIVTRDKRIQKKAALDEVMAVTEALVAGNHAF